MQASVLEEILSKLSDIEERLCSLERKACDINKSCKGMDDHISFIDSIYQKLRKPLLWISNRFSVKQVDSLPMAPTEIKLISEISECDSDSDSDSSSSSSVYLL